MANDNIIISIAEETAIKDKAPDKLPLNPTAQGYTGAEVRRRLSAYVTDQEESILSVIKDKLTNVKTKFDYYDDLLTEQLTFNTLSLNGRLFEWDEVSGAITIQLSEQFQLNVGQQMVYYGKAYQENITVGDPVMFAGVEGNHFRLKVATAEVLNANPEYFIGVAAHSFASGEFGYVVEFGLITGVDLPDATYNPGDILWIDTENNGYTTTKPPRNKSQIRVATVIEVNQNVNETFTGTLFVRPTVLEGAGGIQTFLQDTEPEVSFDGDLWFDTSSEGE
jgi:hypothetical protein